MAAASTTPKTPAVASVARAAAGGAVESPEVRDTIVIRFAGDAGDGMQLAGSQFTLACAVFGNSVCTLPDFPAEIRAPAGSLAGVSGFQVHFGSRAVHTPGDVVDALVAMNPAALRTNLADLAPGAILVINVDAFTPAELSKAGFARNPLHDGSLAGYRVFAVPIHCLTHEAVAPLQLIPREADRCKNFFALGLACALFERPLEPTCRWIREKFKTNPAVCEANARALGAGYDHARTSPAAPRGCRVPPAQHAPGRYRHVTGTDALVLGLLSAAERAGLPLVFAGTPNAPAGDVLHRLAELASPQVRTLQAEDELAAVSMALGAAFGGALGVVAVTGAGMSLGSEGLGLAVMTELPCVIINVQRGGPSTGLPTKTEQADLLQALFGRHGECPVPVLAPASPADAFAVVYEAARLALRYMTPVVVLADLFLTQSAQPWRIPTPAELPVITTRRLSTSEQNTCGTTRFLPYLRDQRLARPWAIPGTPGLEHRLGGLEKEEATGNVSYDPLNHQAMVDQRATKVAGMVADVPPLQVDGPEQAELLVLGWGSTFGAIHSAVSGLQARGLPVACAHLRHLHPLPGNLPEVLARFRKVLVPELNRGQLRWLLQAQFLRDTIGLHKVQGRPFLVREIVQKIEELLAAP